MGEFFVKISPVAVASYLGLHDQTIYGLMFACIAGAFGAIRLGSREKKLSSFFSSIALGWATLWTLSLMDMDGYLGLSVLFTILVAYSKDTLTLITVLAQKFIERRIK